ncbi:hypothetical protein JCM11754A_25750 [Isoptericola variabilis]
MEYRAGQVDVDRRITTGDYLTRWLDGKEAAGSIRPSTVRGYRDVITKYVAPTIGTVRLADLTAGHLDRMYSQIRRDHPNVTPATIQRVHRTLRSAIRTAVKRGEVKHDVTAHVELPQHRRPKVRPWEPAEYAAFIGSEAVRGHRLRPAFVLAAMGGLRRGEVVALRWDDVDLDRAVLTVRRQATQVGDTIRVRPRRRRRARTAPSTWTGRRSPCSASSAPPRLASAWRSGPRTRTTGWCSRGKTGACIGPTTRARRSPGSSVR